MNVARSDQQILDRLGPEGLSRVLEDLFDRSRLARLANSCGLKYRGMRTQSQSAERLVADLVARAAKEDETRKAIMRATSKEMLAASREWSALKTEDRLKRLCDKTLLRSNGNVGRHLYLLASVGSQSDSERLTSLVAHHHLLDMGTNGSAPVGDAAARDAARLTRRLQARDRKIKHLDLQLAKARDMQRTAKRDLIERKGELAESRMLAERLRQELTRAENTLRTTSGKGSDVSEKKLDALNRTVQKLTTEQKRVTRELKDLGGGISKERTSAPSALTDGIKTLEKQLATAERERKVESKALQARIEALRGDLKNRPADSSAKSRSAKRPRPRGAARRVGVFVDVQNVYYGARRLKGKLDFDALLEGALEGRRLIKSVAYVVESKETDQSQFIALLQKKGIEVRRKALRVRADGSMKGDWDMELALDILDATPSLDVVVLVSGDGDFTSLVKRVKSMGPRVEVMGFPRASAKSLIEAADNFRPLDRKFMIYSRRSTRSGAGGKGKESATDDAKRATARGKHKAVVDSEKTRR